jgi:nitric oxide reductase NorD protein
VGLDELYESLGQLGEDREELLRASWQEASSVFTRSGLTAYLQGAKDLQLLGRGTDLVVAYLQSAPAVARELGEDAVGWLVAAAIRMYSKTSAEVISLVISTAPVAAARLGDPELFRGYLHLLDVLVAQAPRAVRPLLSRLELLLSQLTLGGLRRWAMWGVEAHRHDFEAQVDYFSLTSPESLGVLQRERRGTLFVDVQRRLHMYLRALWGRDFYLRPTSGDFERREGTRPFIEGFVVHLPDAYDDLELLGGPVAGLDLYRAATTHAAAHLVYGDGALSPEGLTLLQMAVIGVVEDARVERLASGEFPGLAPLWRRLHHATPDVAQTTGDYLSRLARALADPSYADPDPVVASGRNLFDRAGADLGTSRESWEVGVALARELVGVGSGFDPRTDLVSAPYRDDNRHLWEHQDPTRFETDAPWVAKQIRRRVSLMELVNEVDVETAGDDAEEIWVLPTELFPYEDYGISYNQLEGTEQPALIFGYPEWDYQMQLHRPSWCSVLERRAPAGDEGVVEQIMVKHAPLVRRIRRIIEVMQPQGVQRMRKQEEGDEIDINAAVSAWTDLRLGRQPDTRVMMRNIRRVRDLSVLVLVDVSESTNDPVPGSGSTVLELAREATALLSEALSGIGDPFAVHGFDSDGRHRVEYFRYKDFDAPYDAAAKRHLAGMTGQLSTRMGAAVRHATAILRRRPSRTKLLLLVTDGEPADNDVRDPQYLRHDAKKAVEEAAANGIVTFCISLDPNADEYVSRIFGARNYIVIDHTERLPERLPALYVSLTR